jgi:hypothetical protein
MNRVQMFFRIRVLSPAKAAQIICGIEQETSTVIVGRDSMLMDKHHRLNPNFAARAIAQKMAHLFTT